MSPTHWSRYQLALNGYVHYRIEIKEGDVALGAGLRWTR